MVELRRQLCWLNRIKFMCMIEIKIRLHFKYLKSSRQVLYRNMKIKLYGIQLRYRADRDRWFSYAQLAILMWAEKWFSRKIFSESMENNALIGIWNDWQFWKHYVYYHDMLFLDRQTFLTSKLTISLPTPKRGEHAIPLYFSHGSCVKEIFHAQLHIIFSSAI